MSFSELKPELLSGSQGQWKEEYFLLPKALPVARNDPRKVGVQKLAQKYKDFEGLFYHPGPPSQTLLKNLPFQLSEVEYNIYTMSATLLNKSSLNTL